MTKKREFNNMNVFLQIITNPVLFIPAISWIVAQILKTIINAIMNKKLSLDRLVGDGGMPSGHSATVMSLAVLCGWGTGFNSAIFAVALVLAIIVMHDATGVRREAGKQATVIKQLTEAFNSMFFEKDEEIRTEKLKEFVGHTPTQVFFGAIVGIIVGVCCIAIMGIEYASITV